MELVTGKRNYTLMREFIAHRQSGSTAPFTGHPIAAEWSEGVTPFVLGAFALCVLTAFFTFALGVLKADCSSFVRLPTDLSSYPRLKALLSPVGPAALVLRRVLLRRLCFFSITLTF